MSGINASLKTIAVKVNNYIEDATVTGTGNDKFDSTTLQEYEVPAGKRWFLLFMLVKRDVASNLTVSIRDTADKIIGTIVYLAAGTDSWTWPSTYASTNEMGPGDIILDAGEYINIAFGVAQGAGASASCVVLEVVA